MAEEQLSGKGNSQFACVKALQMPPHGPLSSQLPGARRRSIPMADDDSMFSLDDDDDDDDDDDAARRLWESPGDSWPVAVVRMERDRAIENFMLLIMDRMATDSNGGIVDIASMCYD